MDRILPSTMEFLKDLDANNNRVWFTENKPAYTKEKDNVVSFLNNLKAKLEEEDQIEKMHLFRIYRDVRFSKDKTPYKTHFGGSFSRATNRRRGGYYFHISPNDSFIGGGFFSPNPKDLFRIRKEIEMDDQPLRDIINAPSFVKAFGAIQGDELKSAPRGFAKDHNAIDLLRKKQFYVMHRFTDKEMSSPKILDNAFAMFKELRPYFDYMTDVLTTDLNGESILD